MQIEIRYAPSHSLALCRPGAGELLTVGSGSIVSTTDDVALVPATGGGLLEELASSVLGDEAFSCTAVSAERNDAEVMLASTVPGDIIHWQLTGQTIHLAAAAFLAAGGDIDVAVEWDGKRTTIGPGRGVVRITGSGDLLVASAGAVHAVELGADQTRLVDPAHLVGWSASVTHRLRRQPGWRPGKDACEVVALSGPGQIYLQTRAQPAG